MTHGSIISKWRNKMGNRDFVRKEKKKPKKDARKQNLISSTLEAPRPEVEVIRKGKKPREIEEEE
jgi:hypothetical protein